MFPHLLELLEALHSFTPIQRGPLYFVRSPSVISELAKYNTVLVFS